MAVYLLRSTLQITICKISVTKMFPSHCLRATYCYSTMGDKKKEVNTLVLSKYLIYIKNFEDLVGKRFPKAMTVYRGFMEGIKLFYQDAKLYVKILTKVNTPGNSLRSLTRKELEIYDQVPKDLVKLAPVLIGFSLPLVYTLVFPIAYMFPRHFLTDHFLTKEQKVQFFEENMLARLRQNGHIVKLLSDPCTLNQKNSSLHQDKLFILLQTEMKTKQLLLPHKIIGCIELFKTKPFALNELSNKHIKHLTKLHNLGSFWFPKKKLRHRAQMLLAMDRAIIKEGGIQNLSPEDMKKVCEIRGLYVDELDRETMMKWLNKWMHISVSVDDKSSSLILHAPSLLGYNAPSNRRLIKSHRSAIHKIRLGSRAAYKRLTN